MKATIYVAKKYFNHKSITRHGNRWSLEGRLAETLEILDVDHSRVTRITSVIVIAATSSVVPCVPQVASAGLAKRRAISESMAARTTWPLPPAEFDRHCSFYSCRAIATVHCCGYCSLEYKRCTQQGTNVISLCQ